MTWLAHHLRKVQSPGEVDSRHCPPPAQNQTTPFKSPEYLDHVFQMQFYVLPGASNYPFSWLTGQETYAFLPIALSSFSFLSYCTVPTPLLKAFQTRANCFPNALRSHPPQIVFDWSSSMFSLSLLFLLNAPSSPPGNLPQQGVHGRYISQPLLLWLPWSKVGLGTEFLIQNHSLPPWQCGWEVYHQSRFRPRCWLSPEVWYSWAAVCLLKNGLIVSGTCRSFPPGALP